MRRIGILNTWIGSKNIGDHIIMDSCKKAILKNFRNDFYLEVPTHLSLIDKEFVIIKDLNYIFICGTNLLSSKMNIRSRKSQWKIGIKFLYFIWKNKINNIILLGVGWSSYTKQESFLGKLFWRVVLSKNYTHSVRDEYTKEKLKKIGITNVINTGCPTTWELTNELCEKIPKNKSEKVIVTLTDYNKDYEKDRKMFEILKDNYKEIFIWPQSFEDIDYIKNLLDKDFNYKLLAPNLETYDNFLDNYKCDYIGTRLHGGIRALQKGKRVIIIGIDNRALEMKEINLPILNRNNIEQLNEMINNEKKLNLKLHSKEITKWNSQFNN